MAVRIVAVPIGVVVVQLLRWPGILLSMMSMKQNAVVKLAYLLMHLICYPLRLILCNCNLVVVVDELDVCTCIV